MAWTEISLKDLTMDEISQLSSRVIMNRKFQHKHLKSVVSSWIPHNSQSLVLISEIVTGGSLIEYLNRLPQPTLNLAKIWGRGILMGLNYLHSLVPIIVHRGISSKSIKIMSSDGTIKLTDFFINQVFINDPWSVEDPWFYAPETYEGTFTHKSDIYSFGMVLLQILTKTCPYSECRSLNNIYESILNRTLPKSIEFIQDLTVKNLIISCLSDPHKRPSASDLLSHPFFVNNTKDNSGHNFEKIENFIQDDSAIKKISLIIFDSHNKARNVSFEYDVNIDTPEKVAMEMVESFDMGLKAVGVVIEQIKKKLVFDEESPKSWELIGLEKPLLKSSYSFDELNCDNNENLVVKFKKMLISYYALGSKDIDWIDARFHDVVKNFQRDIGVVSDGNITDKLYRVLKDRVSKYL